MPFEERLMGLWHNKLVLAILIVLALGLIVSMPDTGVLGAFVIAIAAAVIARKQGSYRDMGFRAPASWPKLMGRTLLYGFVILMLFTILIDPALERATGKPLDISVFDGVRGDFANYLVLMAIGWIVGGFFEELTFRGFVVGRVRWLLGSGAAATWSAVVIAAVPFGIAHWYQGITGMIDTGLIGFVLGAVYVYHRFNLWYAVFTHGFFNTFAITAIFLDIDRDLQGLLY